MGLPCPGPQPEICGGDEDQPPPVPAAGPVLQEDTATAIPILTNGFTAQDVESACRADSLSKGSTRPGVERLGECVVEVLGSRLPHRTLLLLWLLPCGRQHGIDVEPQRITF